jgi:hypothetical protein
MATAPTQARAPAPIPSVPASTSEPSSMEFLILENNVGEYIWSIVSGDGTALARSSSFASAEQAHRAARRVRDGASSSTLAAIADTERPLVAA